MYFDHIYFLNFSLTPLSTRTSLCTQLERFLFPFKPLESNLCHLTILGSETFEPGLVAHASNPECQKAEARGFSTCEASLVYIESTRVARGTHLDSGFKNNFFSEYNHPNVSWTNRIPMDLPNWWRKAHETSTPHKKSRQLRKAEIRRGGAPLGSTHQLVVSAQPALKPYIQVISQDSTDSI